MMPSFALGPNLGQRRSRGNNDNNNNNNSNNNTNNVNDSPNNNNDKSRPQVGRRRSRGVREYEGISLSMYIYIYIYIERERQIDTYIYIYIQRERERQIDRYRVGLLHEEMCTLLDVCVSSLRRGHANLLYVVPSLTDGPRRESKGRLESCERGRLDLQCGDVQGEFDKWNIDATHYAKYMMLHRARSQTVTRANGSRTPGVFLLDTVYAQSPTKIC